MSRLNRILPEDMTPEQLEIYEKFNSGERAKSAFSLVHPEGGLIGPPAAWLLSPPLAEMFEHAGGTMRFRLSLTPRCIEIALLLHGYHRDCAFEIDAHRRAGAAAGLTEDDMDGLAMRKPPVFESEEERVVFQTTISLLDHRDLDDDQFAEAESVLGLRKLFELISLVGYYDLIAMQLEIFRIRPLGSE